MITLYHCERARSFRPLWMMEEMGLAYDLRMLPFPPRVLAKDFLEINPLGTVPFFIDGSARMSESPAICHYLGTRYGPSDLIVDVAEESYGTFLNWMYFSDATLTFPQTLVLRYGKQEPAERRSPQVAADYAKWFHGRLRVVEVATGDTEFLCAGRFTAADIAIGYALRLAGRVGIDGDFGPNISAYWQRLQQRESYIRSLRIEREAAARAGIPESGSPIPVRAQPGSSLTT
jgi:glutathione S-transferase